METEKLYLDEPLRLAFQARLLAVSRWQGQTSVLLDRSAFYGESGGQLGDRGLLLCDGNPCRIGDTQYDEKGRLHHLVAGDPPPLREGAPVEGSVEFAHRRDMMSQHTGQHLLSAIFYRELAAETLSSRLGSRSSTLDLDIAHLEDDQVERVVDLVNEVILENRPIRPLYPDKEQLEAMNLRRMPKVTRHIRILEIEAYDRTPCGGTHCSATGQIGPLFITGRERYKGGMRLHFLVGRRVLEHHRGLAANLNHLGERLGCGAAGVLEAVTRMENDLRERSLQLGQTRADLVALLRDRIYEQHPAPPTGTTRIVLVRRNDDLDTLRALAAALAKRADVVAMVAGRDPKSGDWRLIVERGDGADFHAGTWFREQGRALGGRGGGRPNRAEGSFPGEVDLAVALGAKGTIAFSGDRPDPSLQ